MDGFNAKKALPVGRAFLFSNGLGAKKVVWVRPVLAIASQARKDRAYLGLFWHYPQQGVVFALLHHQVLAQQQRQFGGGLLGIGYFFTV